MAGNPQQAEFSSPYYKGLREMNKEFKTP